MEKFEFKETLEKFVGEISPILKESPHAGEIRASYKELWDQLGKGAGEE